MRDRCDTIDRGEVATRKRYADDPDVIKALDEILDVAKPAAIFVAVGAGWGVLSGYGALVGSVTALLLFGFMMGSNRLMEWIDRFRR